jgi:hypothetical protein
MDRTSASAKAGDEQGARDAVEQAAGIYERKGNLAAIALISG